MSIAIYDTVATSGKSALATSEKVTGLLRSASDMLTLASDSSGLSPLAAAQPVDYDGPAFRRLLQSAATGVRVDGPVSALTAEENLQALLAQVGSILATSNEVMASAAATAGSSPTANRDALVKLAKYSKVVQGELAVEAGQVATKIAQDPNYDGAAAIQTLSRDFSKENLAAKAEAAAINTGALNSQFQPSTSAPQPSSDASAGDSVGGIPMAYIYAGAGKDARWTLLPHSFCQLCLPCPL